MNARTFLLSLAISLSVFALIANETWGGFDVTWETDTSTLRDKLLAGGMSGLPAGVTITGVTLVPDPEDIDEDETAGYYESFDLDDGSTALSIPDGVVLTTGYFSSWIGDSNLLPDFGQNNYDDGDADIQALYAVSTNIQDGVAVILTFTTDATIGGMRFQMILASDEFPYYAEPEPKPEPESEPPVSPTVVSAAFVVHETGQDAVVLPSGGGTVVVDLVTTSASLGGLTRDALPAGEAVVAALTLEVAGVPGTYHLTFADGKFVDADMLDGTITTGVALTIVVQGD